MANYDLTYEGSVVQDILDTGKSLEDNGYIFMGAATTSTAPGTPTERVAYIGGPGTYNNFGSTTVVPSGSVGVFKYNGSAWVNDVIAATSDGCVYAGIATPTTNPGTPTSNVFYVAVTAGTYTNFGGLTVTQGINILKYNGSAWSVEQVVGIDNEPIDGSKNLVESGGVINNLKKIEGSIGYKNISGTTSTGSINSTGGIRTDSYALHTDFIEIDKTIKYFIISRLSDSWYAAFYSSNSESSFLSSLRYPNELSGPYTLELNIPDNAVYMRVSFQKSSLGYGLYTLRDVGSEIDSIYEQVDELSLKTEQREVNIEDSIGYVEDVKISTVTSTGSINSSGGVREDANALHTDFIEIDHTLRYAVKSIMSRLWYAAFYSSDSESSFISSQQYVDSVSEIYTLELNIPSTARYMRVTYYKVNQETVGLFIYKSLKNVNSILQKDEKSIDDIINSIGYANNSVSTSTNIGSINSSGGIREDANALYTDFIEIDQTKDYFVISLLSSLWYAAFYSSNTEESFISAQQYPNKLIEPYSLKIEIPSDAVYMRVTYFKNNAGLYTRSLKDVDSQDIIYVNWDSGNDNNIGNEAHPLRTVKEALNRCSDIKNNEIYITGTGAHDFHFNDDELNISNKNIKFVARSSSSVRFKFGHQLSVSYNSVTGYYETENVQFDASTYLNFALYEDGVLDTETEILASERHPLQRGKLYRMESVQYKQYTSSTIASVVRGFYYDGTKFIIKSQNELSSIWMPSISFIQFTDSQIVIKDIDILYTSIRLQRCYFEAEDCRFMYGASPIVGLINYRASQIKMTRCEVCGTLNSSMENSATTGDGICGQADGSVSYRTNQLSATLIDVWSHDNQDDGFSDHGRGVSTFIGGLYEYNRKGGVIPAQNCKGTIIGVTARRQRWGITTVNQNDQTYPNEKYQGIECIDCITENNSQAGFRNGMSSAIMICRNCIAVNEIIGYQGNGNENMTFAYGCKAVSCQTKTSDTVNIYNGENL